MTVSQRIIAALSNYDPLPLDYDDLAAEVGASRASIQTSMTRLTREGLVHREGGRGRCALMRLNHNHSANAGDA